MTAELVFEGWDDALALHLCRNMRDQDAAEIYPMRADDDAWALYRDLASMLPAHVWLEIARPAVQMKPVAIYGAIWTSPGVVSAYMFGTDQLTLKYAREIAVRVRTVGVQTLIDASCHRAEAVSLSTYGWAHRFMRAAGGRREGPRVGVGRDGEDYESFIWLKKETDNVPT